jgi:hypothetical protein
VQGGHRGEFVGEPVVSPDGSFPAGTVDCVYESGGLLVRLSFFQDTQRRQQGITHPKLLAFLPISVSELSADSSRGGIQGHSVKITKANKLQNAIVLLLDSYNLGPAGEPLTSPIFLSCCLSSRRLRVFV